MGILIADAETIAPDYILLDKNRSPVHRGHIDWVDLGSLEGSIDVPYMLDDSFCG